MTELVPKGPITIDSLVDSAYRIAHLKGFHEEDASISFGDRIALAHSELSEALEAFREGHGPRDTYHGESNPGFSVPKPEGIPSELADVVIRVADMCGVYGIDLEESIREKLQYNLTRPYRNGKVKL